MQPMLSRWSATPPEESSSYDPAGGDMQVRFKIFKSSVKSWPDLCAEAAEFASEKGREQLINVSVSEDHNDGVIIVWYWE
jgi:hypothetical protein